MALIPWLMPANLIWSTHSIRRSDQTLRDCVILFRDLDDAARGDVVGLECDASVYLPGFGERRTRLSPLEINRLAKHLLPKVKVPISGGKRTHKS